MTEKVLGQRQLEEWTDEIKPAIESLLSIRLMMLEAGDPLLGPCESVEELKISSRAFIYGAGFLFALEKSHGERRMKEASERFVEIESAVDSVLENRQEEITDAYRSV